MRDLVFVGNRVSLLVFPIRFDFSRPGFRVFEIQNPGTRVLSGFSNFQQNDQEIAKVEFLKVFQCFLIKQYANYLVAPMNRICLYIKFEHSRQTPYTELCFTLQNQRQIFELNYYMTIYNFDQKKVKFAIF